MNNRAEGEKRLKRSFQVTKPKRQNGPKAYTAETTRGYGREGAIYEVQRLKHRRREEEGHKGTRKERRRRTGEKTRLVGHN